MDHADHVSLLAGGVAATGGPWADLGSGTGAFTLALAELLGPGGMIYSVDKDAGALAAQERALRSRFPQCTLVTMLADFTRPLVLPPLDGLVMANSLHFIRDKGPLLRLVQGYLKPGGTMIIVEYDTDQRNPWVPYPFSYRSWQALARAAGLTNTRLLTTVPSRFLGQMYAAASVRGQQWKGDVRA
jgi:ubiquinone/menaquinone biosynthesis C-methylase UbiE